MNVSDYIINFLIQKKVDTIFMITGGQAMFLNDAVSRSKKIKYICNHHEQAVGMAAEAYGRISGKLGVALVTAGPASVNVMNGVVGAWVDSSPMLVLSGQSPLTFVQYQQKHKIRQYGIQGINIKPLVGSITKFFVTVDDPSLIKYYIQKAYYLAFNGRPGPVWLDVPLDIQRMEVPKKMLKEFIPPIDDNLINTRLKKDSHEILNAISKAKRPIIIAGQGVRLCGAVKDFQLLVKKLQIPILTSRLGIDLIESENKLYVGRPGTYGERAAHFAIQNADLIVVLGSRLSSSTIGHNPKDFGRHAKKIMVDIDVEELNKPGVDIQFKINQNVKNVIEELVKQLNTFKLPKYDEWIKKCNFWKQKYPVVLPEYKNEKPVNSYYFVDRLSKLVNEKSTILVDTGSCFHVACQTWKVKKNQRFMTTGGISTMGYWVAGIGAHMALKKNKTIIITGDGSMQFNIQELATIKQNKLPVKIFIFNNNGYLLIRHTQVNYMNKRLIGVDEKSGLWCPDALKIAASYEIKGVRINSVWEVDRKIKEVLSYKGPVICDVMTPHWQALIPRSASVKDKDGSLIAKPFEDMYPFLPKEELESNMMK
ncbi:hypothetical protein A3A93_02775 [Candidatus Roizmanbacteria bacterium RIFCSPLOWO2_01_FULL_38_12]|uniref:Acetolactate synthase n=1 Tax=Candidatus Roizmanbacteria bacterium RIFCSPLOWO2_01_FULL_38_12 TaxID=1802061 RepID=A0A1F7IUI7_9BACT|nr:MAG: hypothetical protein A2861_01850 [Candidatus Roizmanbacteria bacterium RIFCSPHIGHO2_01_FULL_38_15]OGK47021.1 MAG: hypothetical protein A3A93_02775 [Candidatus Roizmanbacteria bacterium RIFCSPLOWO2_01_FULL_38_12]